MKTLDEVIDSITKQSGLEIRDQLHPEKDRFWVNRETYNDALFYLKEYRSEKQIWESDRNHYEDWIEQYKDSRNKHQQAVTEMLKNPPLTWDELKQMVEEPVWIEYEHSNHRDSGKRWFIIKWFGDLRGEIMAVHVDGIYFDKDSIGKTWKAYRKEKTNVSEIY